MLVTRLPNDRYWVPSWNERSKNLIFPCVVSVHLSISLSLFLMPRISVSPPLFPPLSFYSPRNDRPSITNKVFFDVEIEGGSSGRIVMGLFGDVGEYLPVFVFLHSLVGRVMLCCVS